MSKRMYVHTKHEIEYGASRFNYQNEEFYCLMGALNVDVYDGDNDGFGDEIEMGREYLEFAREYLKKCAETNFSANPDDEYDMDDVVEALEALYHNGKVMENAKECIDDISMWLETAAPGDYIHFSWF